MDKRTRSTRVATDTHIPRYLAGLYLDTALYGANPVEMAQVDVWLDLAHDQLASGSDYKQLSVVLARLDAHLKMRTFLVNYRLTLADIVVWACVRGTEACHV